MTYGSHSIVVTGGNAFPGLGQPGNLTVSPGSITQTQATATWTAGLNAVSYIVFLNGAQVITTPGLTFTFTGLTQGTTYTVAVEAVGIAGQVSPPTAPVSFTTQSSTSPYNFTLFISTVAGGANDANDGSSPVPVGPQPGVGPWTLGSLLNQTYMHPTAKQIANNNAMAGQQVGVVGDQGVVSLADAGIAYPNIITGNANVLCLPSGTASAQTVLASCNSSGQYVRGLAVLDGGITTATVLGMLTTNIESTFDFVGRSDTGTNCQYITVDGFEIRNCINSGVCFRQAGSINTNLPGWVAKNNFIHNVYNCNEGASFSGSCTGGILTVPPTLNGTIRVGQTVWNTAGGTPGPGLGVIAAFGTGGTTGTGGAGTYSIGGSIVFSGTIGASSFSGNNLAGISFHGGLAPITTNNFIEDVIDLNTALNNNKRADGIKHWVCRNANTTFNTIYATAATGYPTGGIEHKNVPQYDNVIANNYIHLANAVVQTGVDIIGIAVDGGNPATAPIPAGSFYTINNNIIIANPNGNFGVPGVAGGGPTNPNWICNWFNNTTVGVGSPGLGGFTRFGPAATPILNFHDNICDRATPPAGGNGGDFRCNLDCVTSIDFDIWPSNYLLTLALSGGTSVTSAHQYSVSQNGGISGMMTVLAANGTTGLEAHVEIGTPTYVNASKTNFTNKKASDWQISPTSPFGHGTGTGGADKGAWGGQTQIGCNFRDPSG